jgi:hypothetical protein
LTPFMAVVVVVVVVLLLPCPLSRPAAALAV